MDRSEPECAHDGRLFLGVMIVGLALLTIDLGGNAASGHQLLRALARGRLSVDAEAGGVSFDHAWVASSPPPAAWAALGACPPPETLASGHLYSGQAPGTAFILLPFFVLGERLLSPALLEASLILVGGVVPLAAFAVATRRSLTRGANVPPDRARELAALAALGTLALPYGTRFTLNELPIALLAVSLAALLRRPEVEGRDRSALAGFLSAAAVVVHFTAAPAAAALALLAARRGRLIAFALGALPPVVALGAYDQACFGRPWSTSYDHRPDPYVSGFMARGVEGFVLPDGRRLISILVGWRGFLGTQPLALLGLLGLLADARREPLPRFGLAVSLLVVLANAARAGDWQGGWTLGARYALVALPFLVLGLPRGLELLGPCARPIAALSVFVAWIGATVEWTYVGSFLGNVRAFLILGPRVRGIQTLLLGAPSTAATRSTVLLAAFTLSVAAPLALCLVRPRTRLRGLAPLLALAPWLVCVPYHVRRASGGPAAVSRAYWTSYSAEAREFAEGTDDVNDLRQLVVVAEHIGDRELKEHLEWRIAERLSEGPHR
jgi:hypothetical protein